MRYALLADIHANLAALDAVLAKLESQSIDRYLSLGDIVGYGPDPAACIGRLVELDCVHIQGNHEARLLDLPTGRFNRVAEAAIEFTARTLDETQKAFLREFPEQTRVDDDILCVHGSPFDRDEYVLSQEQMEIVVEHIEDAGIWLCLCGHTHQQYLYDGEFLYAGPRELTLQRDVHYLINPGSVGQPRDSDPRAAYGILDTEAGHLTLERAPYEVDVTAQRILDAGLPHYLADRLMLGR